MFYCKIEGGVVVDRAVFDSEMPAEWPDREAWVHDDLAQIGWTFADGVLVPPEPPSPPAPTSAMVDFERERRESAGIMFNGKMFQSRPDDLRNISGAATGAAVAIMGGAEAGDLRWQHPDRDFGWIATDNTEVAMDAQTMIAFGQAAMAHISMLVWSARSIKDRLLDGEELDITDDALWALPSS